MLTAEKGRYGKFGGTYLPEILMGAILDLLNEWNHLKKDASFLARLSHILKTYAGRPTPLTEIANFSEAIQGPQIFLKREDLLHTGAHKLNNALGQCLLAKEIGKKRIVAETGAGQHGVATAAACAYLGLPCVIYMGAEDMKRQQPNVLRIRLMGAEVIPVTNGSATLKDAVNEALRDWSASFETTHYCLGSALGPHPYPEMVAAFQSVIGEEVKSQFSALFGIPIEFQEAGKAHTKSSRGAYGLYVSSEMSVQHSQNLKDDGYRPDAIFACVGGGSNAIGIFSAFLEDEQVALIGVEAGGHGDKLGEHAARFQMDTPGVLHGCYTYLLQNEEGQIAPTASISAGLDYPGVGPQHADLFYRKRAQYISAKDHEAIEALKLLARTEGIICALESAHALAGLIKLKNNFTRDQKIVVNLSGRGDKDIPQLIENDII